MVGLDFIYRKGEAVTMAIVDCCGRAQWLGWPGDRKVCQGDPNMGAAT